MVLMPDPDIAGHHGDKNTQTDGRVHEGGGGLVVTASTTEDFGGKENYNYNRMLTSDYVVRKAFNGCPVRDNDLPGRYKCKDNHTQNSVAVEKMTPSPHYTAWSSASRYHQLQNDYLTTG